MSGRKQRRINLNQTLRNRGNVDRDVKKLSQVVVKESKRKIPKGPQAGVGDQGQVSLHGSVLAVIEVTNKVEKVRLGG